MRKAVYIWILLIAGSCNKASRPDISTHDHQDDLEKLELSLNDKNFIAGDTVVVSGVSPIPMMARLTCLITHALGEYHDEIDISGCEFSYTVPLLITEKSGAVYISFLKNHKLVQTIDFKISPGLPYDRIDSYSGPATIESSGIDWNLVTAIAIDQFDNPCEDGTEMNFRLKYPDGRIRNKREEMSMLLSGVRINPTRKSGKIFTGVQSGEAHSAEREVLVTPAWPERFTIEVIDYLPYAEQRQVLKLRTSIIKDRFGNTVSDGTAVWFITEDSRGVTNQYKSFVVNGRCNVQIENPEYATRWKITAQVENSVSSYSKYLRFSSTSKRLPLDYNPDNQMLQIGPITGPLGQFVPNGVMISLELWKDQMLITSVDKEVLFGYYTWALPVNLMHNGAYRITASIGDSKEEMLIRYHSATTNEINPKN